MKSWFWLFLCDLLSWLFILGGLAFAAGLVWLGYATVWSAPLRPAFLLLIIGTAGMGSFYLMPNHVRWRIEEQRK